MSHRVTAVCKGQPHTPRSLRLSTLLRAGAAVALASACALGMAQSTSAPPADAAPPQLTQLSPSDPSAGSGALRIPQGHSGLLQATLSPVPNRAGVLTLSSSAPQIASVPERLGFAAGQSRIAVPVAGGDAGLAQIRVSLGDGASLSAGVQVTPVAPRLQGFAPTAITLRPGATASLRLSLWPQAASAPIRVRLLSTDPGKVSVPQSIQIAAGEREALVPLRPLAAGSARIEAQIAGAADGAGGAEAVPVSAHVQVSEAPLALLGVQVGHGVGHGAAPATLQQGAQTSLTVRLSSIATTPVTVGLSAEPPSVLELPTSLVVPVGQSEASVLVRARTGGPIAHALVQASLTPPSPSAGTPPAPTTSLAQTLVVITPQALRPAALQPTQTLLAPGATTRVRLRLNAAPAQDTRVALRLSPAGIAQVPAELTVPAGQAEVDIPVSAVAPGLAELQVRLNGVSRRAAIGVSAEPLRLLPGRAPTTLRLQRGASTEWRLSLSAAAPTPLTLSLSSSEPTVAQVPAALTIPAGQRELSVPVSALQSGQASVQATLSANASGVASAVQAGAVQASVRVSDPSAPLPPGFSLQPDPLDIALGHSQPLRVTLATAQREALVLALSNDAPGVVAAPHQFTIAPGQTEAFIPLHSLSQGTATVRARLGFPSAQPPGAPVQAQVNVVAPQIERIVLSPDPLELSVLQTAPLDALAHYSDTSTRQIGRDNATQWRADPTAVARIDAAGRVRGQQSGRASAIAEQPLAPLRGQEPQANAQGEGEISVSGAGALSLTAARQSLLAGESLPVFVGLPHPYEQPVQIALAASAGLQVPSRLNIPAGQRSASLSVRAISPLQASTTTATLSASALGEHQQLAPAQLSLQLQPVVLPGPVVSAVVPDSASPGARIRLIGSGFAPQPSAHTVVFAGNAPATVHSASATELVVQVPALAQSGPIAVSSAPHGASAQSPVFTVVREEAFELQASPAELSLVAGSRASASIGLSNTGQRPFEGLAQLGVAGLPAGLTARFEPPQLNTQQSASLILSAEAGAAPGQYTLSLRAEASLNGAPWVRERQIVVQLLDASNQTGVQGRFLTPEGQGIAGVIVRQDHSTNQSVSDAAGNFSLLGLSPGQTTLRFDATPAHSLYPIWPYSLTLQAGEVRTLGDWTINPPPSDERFTPIANAAANQAITDERYPGFAVTLPAGVSITGWDGVKKTRIAVERLTPDKLPVSAPPFAMKEAYQLYFGTPMGGIPSAPIPVTLPNVSGKDPGDKVNIWFFDGSPMGGTGEWRVAGQGTVSADGQSVSSDPGAGLTRFCGVCGLVSLDCPPVAESVKTSPQTCPPQSGNPIEHYSGIELASVGGPQCGGTSPLSSGLVHNPIDAFQNRAGTLMSAGWGWTLEYDVGFLPFAGPQKRLLMPGGSRVDFVQDPSRPDEYRPVDDPRHAGSVARAVAGGAWEITRSGGEVWRFEAFAGTSGLIRGGAPMFLTRISDANGNTTVLSRQNNGRLLGVQGSGGRALSLGYGANGFINELRDHTGRKLSLEYTSEAQPRISAVTDAAGRRTEYEYQAVPIYRNADGSTACQAELPAGEPRYIRRVRYPHSAQATENLIGAERVLKQTTSTGEVWKFAYRRVGACVVKVSDEASKTAAFTCRAGQGLSTAAGVSTGALTGTCPEIENGDSHAQGWRFYGGVNVQTTVTQPDGASLSTVFNAKGLPTEHTDAAGQRTKKKYDNSARLIEVIDPLGRTTKHEYDQHGNRTASVDPLGHRTETKYESQRNLPIGMTRFLMGVPSEQGGQQLSYTPLQSSLGYDGKGNLTQLLDPTGVAAQMAYDGKGQLSLISLPAKTNASSLPITSEGQASSIAKADRKIALAYNAAGDLIRITDALNNSTSLGTDALGRTTELTDALGYTNTQGYNGLDQPTEARNPLGHTSRIEYDAVGRVTAVINEMGNPVERYGYDGLGRLVEVVDALDATTLITYDSSNRAKTITDRKGQVTTLSYNERGQVSRIERVDQTIEVMHDAVGRVSEVRDAASANSYRYDAADRLIEAKSSTAAGLHTLSYGYDSLNRVTTRTLSGTAIASPETTDYRWDHADRLLEHTTTINGTAHKTEYEYDAAARLAARHVQAGVGGKLTQRYGYDQAERLAQIKYIRKEGAAGEQLIEQIDYSYDAKGQRIGKTTLNGHGTGKQDTPMQASYDAANRMTAITLTVNGATKAYTLSHDANGNLTTKQNNADLDDRTSYSWDSNNRLIGITQPGLSASFTYDAYGRRIQSSITKNGRTSTVQYIYEGLQALGEIRDQTLSHRLLTGLSLDETIARLAISGQGRKDAAMSRLYMTDALNSVIAQMNDDDTASLANSYAYSPYGLSSVVGADATDNPIQYTSRENDGTGLIFYRNRFRYPIEGWISDDLIGLEGGANFRGVLDGDPISLVDPTGEAGKIPKNFGRGKPMPDPKELPGQINGENSRRQGNSQDYMDSLKCYFGLRNCEAESEILKATRCEAMTCTSLQGNTFEVDINKPECVAYDPGAVTCICKRRGLNPRYIGGPPPGLGVSR